MTLPQFQWRKDIFPLLLFLLLPILSFPELFVEQRTLYRGDITWIHYPQRILAAEQWLAGDIPLWNPYVLSGMPLLAEAQIGVLQPLNALFLLPLPPYRTLTLFVSLHLTLAASGTYFLVRSLGLSRGAAMVSGLSFGFGGFLMAQVTNMNIMSGAAWLPIVFLCFFWTMRFRHPAIAILGGLSLALHILAAQPQIPFYVTLLLLGYALYETFRSLHQPKAIARLWMVTGLFLGTGLLLAAPQILPTWELQQLSVRTAGVDYQQMTAFSLPPLQWITLALPNVFGTSATGYHGLAGNFEEMNLYIGLLPLIMLFFSWRMRHRTEVRFLGGVVFIGWFLSAGSYTPLYHLLAELPGFNLFRAPARWSLIVTFALSLLAGYGFESFLRHPPRERLRWGLLGLWLTVSGILLLLWLFQEPLLDWVQNQKSDTDLNYVMRELLRRGLFEIPEEYDGKLLLGPLALWITPAVALISRLGVITLLLMIQQRLSRPVFVSVITGVLAVDMALTGGTAVNPLTQADHWQQLASGTEYILEAEQDKLARFYTISSSQESSVVAGLKHYFPSVYHIFGSGGTSPLVTERYQTFLDQAHPLVRLALTNTHFVLNQGRLTADAESVLALSYGDGDWFVYEYPTPLPRAFMMRRVVTVENDEQALDYLRNGDFDPSSLLVLETEEAIPPLTEPTTGESVDITQYTPSLVEIEADLVENGFLVLLDNHYPGWVVYVDGEPQPILRAYYIARTVYLEAGTHTVQFIYQPRSFYRGVGLASVGLMMIIGAIVWIRRSDTLSS